MKSFQNSLAILLIWAAGSTMSAATKKVVLVAGKPSHGILAHEYNAGCLLLKKCLDSVPGVDVTVHLNGWPSNTSTLERADAILLFMTGGDRHPAIQEDRLSQLDRIMERGVGFGCVHYAVEVPKDRGGAEFLKWMGGYFEKHWSVNPHWDGDFKTLPKHPITRGVGPFQINDEWYFHMRFQPEMKGVTPILSAVAPDSTMTRPNGPHSGNPAVREAVANREPQHVAWAYERPNGGRGFGFTGAHNHLNWGNENFRKIVLNAILWLAKADVPADGVVCEITQDDVMSNLDPKPGRRPRAIADPPPKNVPFISPTTGAKKER